MSPSSGNRPRPRPPASPRLPTPRQSFARRQGGRRTSSELGTRKREKTRKEDAAARGSNLSGLPTLLRATTLAEAPLTSIPTAPRELTPAWLTAALRSGGALAAAKVVAFETQGIGAGQGFLSEM